MAEAPTPTSEVEIVVADVNEDGTVFLALPDGRHFHATVKSGVELKRKAKVSITSDGEDKDGVPKAAVVTKVLK